MDSINPSFVCLKAAFLALEPANCFIALARQIGGGSLTEDVQNFILELCVQTFVLNDSSGNHKLVKNILKKVIYAVELVRDTVVEGLYEQFAKMSFPQEYVAKMEDNRIVKQISFIFPFGTNDQCSPKSLVVSLHCSLNLLEGDIGCALWPSSLFLSEFILSYPKLFSDKLCFEVHTECLQWEFATERELSKYKPHIVLGADIIYDPKCMPHLIRVLRTLLTSNQSGASRSTVQRETSIAYITSVIRNKDTFQYFLLLAEEAHLSVLDITEDFEPLNLLPYMLSYDRTSVRLFRVSYSFSC